jgi:hypothetical protein
MKTLAEVLAALPDDEARAVVNSAVEAEKTNGITSYRKAKEETNRLLNKFKPIQESLEDLGLDLEAEDLKDRISELKKTGKGNSPDVLAQVKKLERELNAMKQENAQEKEKNLTLKNQAALSKAVALLKGKVVAHDEIAKVLLSDGKIAVGDDGAVLYKTDTGDLELEKGIEDFVRSRPDIAITKQNGGSGGTGGTQGNGNNKTMTQANFDKLAPKAQAEFMKSVNYAPGSITV